MKMLIKGVHIHDGNKELLVNFNNGDWVNFEPQEDCMGKYMNVVSNNGSIWVLMDSLIIKNV